MALLAPLHYDKARFAAKGRAFRRRRFVLFLDLVDRVLAERDACRILDIGGEPGYWEAVEDLLGARRCHVTMLNLTPFAVASERFASVVGDARELGRFADMSFDVVHSNSVIEHIGPWHQMQAMAREIRRLAPFYLVQTPYFWFPVEPHCATPFFHWLPESVRLSMLLRRDRGHWPKAPDVETAMRQIQSAVLLDCRMLASLFPDAVIHRERVFGLTKSLIAIRRDGQGERVGAASPERPAVRETAEG